MSLFLGIDFGTSGVRTSVINPNKEEIINFSVSIEKPIVKDSLVYQDPSLWWNSLIKNLQFLSTKIDLSKIERLSIDGTSGTVLICDDQGSPIDHALMYNDASSVEEAKLIEKISSGHPIVSSPTNALVRALSLIKKNSAQSYKILHQADWVASKMIEEFKFSDENNALKLGYDCQERIWPNWFNELPLDEDSLPKILIPGQVMGNLKNQELLNLGFNSKLEVVAGTTDSIAAFLATGASQIGEAVTSIGTLSLIHI